MFVVTLVRLCVLPECFLRHSKYAFIACLSVVAYHSFYFFLKSKTMHTWIVMINYNSCYDGIVSSGGLYLFPFRFWLVTVQLIVIITIFILASGGSRFYYRIFFSWFQISILDKDHGLRLNVCVGTASVWFYGLLYKNCWENVVYLLALYQAYFLL